jgi:hypothetical protein
MSPWLVFKLATECVLSEIRTVTEETLGGIDMILDHDPMAISPFTKFCCLRDIDYTQFKSLAKIDRNLVVCGCEHKRQDKCHEYITLTAQCLRSHYFHPLRVHINQITLPAIRVVHVNTFPAMLYGFYEVGQGG